MSVIVEVRVAAADFELGRLFDAGMGPNGVVELETMVPVGPRAVPYFRIRTDRLEPFLAAVRERPLVRRVRVVDDYGEESLLSFEWAADRDALVGGLFDLGIGVLSARGRDGIWTFELRFEDHGDLAAFRDGCVDAGLALEVVRVYDPTSTDHVPFGLTERQREASSSRSSAATTTSPGDARRPTSPGRSVSRTRRSANGSDAASRGW